MSVQRVFDEILLYEYVRSEIGLELQCVNAFKLRDSASITQAGVVMASE